MFLGKKLIYQFFKAVNEVFLEVWWKVFDVAVSDICILRVPRIFLRKRTLSSPNNATFHFFQVFSDTFRAFGKIGLAVLSRLLFGCPEKISGRNVFLKKENFIYYLFKAVNDLLLEFLATSFVMAMKIAF